MTTAGGQGRGSRRRKSPSGVQGQSHGRGSKERSPPEAASFSVYSLHGLKYLFCDTKCVVGICWLSIVGCREIAACSRIFGQNTQFLSNNIVNQNRFLLVLLIRNFK